MTTVETILAANLVHNGLVDVPTTLTDAAYDALMKEAGFDNAIDQETPICTIFSIPKVNMIKYPFPVLTSAKLDGACLVFHFVQNEMRTVLTKSTKQHPYLLERFRPLLQIDLPYKEIVLRCELVAKDRKEVPTASPASLASGAINCTDAAKFADSMKYLQLVLVEIPWYIDTLDQKVAPTQEDVFRMELPIPIVPHNMAHNMEEFQAQKEAYMGGIMPCDGIVYSLPSWRYPSNGVNKSVNYGKYAIKSSESVVTRVKDAPQYTIGIDGLISCVIFFEPVAHNGLTYKQAKFPASKLNTVGVGATISLEFRSGQFPNIDSIVAPSEEPYELLTECPFCHSTLTTSTSGAVHCENGTCVGICRALLQKFMKPLGANIGQKTIEGLSAPTIAAIQRETNKFTIALRDKLTSITNKEFYLNSGAYTAAKLRTLGLTNEFLSALVSTETAEHLKNDIKKSYLTALIGEIIDCRV